MAQQGKISGNPASHRMGNAALKNRRAASWARGEKRKELWRFDQHLRERANMALPVGALTPWQLSKQARAAKRHPVLS